MNLRLLFATSFAFVMSSACTSMVVEHDAIPRDHTPEYFSFSRIDVAYPASLTTEQEALIHRYRPGELVALSIRAWAQETGMWGGPQALRLELRSVRLPARWQWDRHGPLMVGSGVGYRGEDHLDVGVEVLQEQEVLHRMEVVRTFPALHRTIAQVHSSERAIEDLTSDVAWQIVFELTPPGYDEGVIRAGHRDGVAAATVVAERRGLLGIGEIFEATATQRDREAGLADKYCALTLAKPGWMPWWLWVDPISWKKCHERAEEDARRR